MFGIRFKILMVAWTIIILFVLAQMTLLSYYEPGQWWSLWDKIWYFWLQLCIGVLLLQLIVLPGYDLIQQQRSLWLKVPLFGLHAVLYGLAYLGTYSLAYEYKRYGTFTAELSTRFYQLFFTDLHNAIKTYLIFIAILAAYDYFRENAQSIIQQKNLENQVDKIRLQSLRAQLQPHFLFNSLNNIVALIEENATQAQQSLIHLSNLLRYTVNLQPLELVPIQEEITTLKQFLAIEKAKYEDQFRVEWQLAEMDPDFRIPPLIVQPLVENAIKHGFVNNSSVLTIVITIDAGHRSIRVANDGTSLPQRLIGGQGIDIVKKRLQIHFGDGDHFRIFQEGRWVVNEIQIHEYS